MKLRWIFGVCLLLIAQANADSGVSKATLEAPSVGDIDAAIKLRGIPLISGLASSLNAGRFNHSFMIDGEVFVAPSFSVGLGVGHSRLTIGGDSVFEETTSSVREDDFIKEFQIGLLATYYFKPQSQSSLYLKAHGFAVLPDTTPGTNNGSTNAVNRARDSFGFRTGLDVGWVIRQGNFLVDFGAGFSAHAKNPYHKFTAENEHGISPGVSNAVFGISDVYPTINASFGFAL